MTAAQPAIHTGPWASVTARRLLEEAVAQKASDLHITVGVPPVLRIDGEIITMPYDRLMPSDTRRLTYEMMTERQIEQFEGTKQVCFSRLIDHLGYFRLNAYYQQGAAECSIRVGGLEVRSLGELGLPPVAETLARATHGLVLVTGPTGVGKTTTFNAMIDLINREFRRKIVTIEDPIEFIHEHKRSIVVQQEVYSDAPSFQSALIHILRQDPDVICVGEMRDLETIATALTAAETGHLVIATLHTTSASQTVDRIIDAFPHDRQPQITAQLGSCLRGVMAQQLLPKIGGGRIVATEVMMGTPAVHGAIREDKRHQLPNIIETSRAHGMHTMDYSLRQLYEQGLIAYDQAVSRARDESRIRDGA
jgi:twitching motility protein PilT